MTPDAPVDVTALCDALRTRNGPTVVVSEEVGLGVHPSTEVGRQFRDTLGMVNAAVAEVAGDVWLVVAGRLLPLAARGRRSTGGRRLMLAALSFLTPLGGAREPDARSFSWFPLVGALIGAAVGAVWWGAGELWAPAVAATVAVLADLALTGALHVDGLADTADGVLPHLDRRRRLEVMAQPDVGAFGVAAVVIILVLRVTVLASMEPNVALLAAAWCASRTLMAVTARAVPYARTEGGLASAFLGGRPGPTVAAVGVACSVVLGAVALGGQGVLAVVAVAVAGAAVVALARRRLGGFTGDVLGAAGLIGETIGLLVASARW